MWKTSSLRVWECLCAVGYFLLLNVQSVFLILKVRRIHGMFIILLFPSIMEKKTLSYCGKIVSEAIAPAQRTMFLKCSANRKKKYFIQVLFSKHSSNGFHCYVPWFYYSLKEDFCLQGFIYILDIIFSRHWLHPLLSSGGQYIYQSKAFAFL